MNAMKNKIKSQRGASITFALLLFLVCSVVSIVVVIAGSAAAGRLSERAETDQRYYAVTSAVELLCDDFKGMTVKVEYSKKSADPKPAASGVTVTSVTDKSGSTKNTKDPKIAVLTAVSTKLVQMIGGLEPENGTYTLTAAGGPEKSALDCTIKEYVKKDGRVIFEVSNKAAAGAAKQNTYALQAVFQANISQSTSQYYAEDGKTAMDRVTTTLVWSVNSIEKGAVPVTGS